MTDLKQRVCELVDDMAVLLRHVSQEIHANPELAFEEFKAAELLTRILEDHGLQVTRAAYGLDTAFESNIGLGDGCVALMAEYDALPGIGHSCGHNLIATAALGAALALSRLGADLPGRVRLLGTPAEESGGGKEIMARAGALDKVDAAMMIHPADINIVGLPCICVATVDVTYHGRSAHAAAVPHKGINALDAMVSGYQAIAQLRQHIRATERVHGIFTAAGEAANIVPARTAAQYLVRAANNKALQPLKQRVEACLRSGALATGCEVDISWGDVDYLDMKNNPVLADAFQHNAERLGRRFECLTELQARGGGLGSTDMGNISHRVPSIHPFIACSPAGVTIHNPEFAHHAASDEGFKAALDGAKSLAMTALDFLSSDDFRDRVGRQFEATG